MLYLGFIFALLGGMMCLYLLFLESHIMLVKPKPMLTFKFPEGLTSADVGIITDGKIDRRDVLSLIPWFVAQGYIRLERKGDSEMLMQKDKVMTNFVLYRLRDLPAFVKDYERTFFEALFPDGETKRTLQFAYDPAFSRGYRDTVDSMVGHVRNRNWSIPAYVYALVFASLASVFFAIACLTTEQGADWTNSMFFLLFLLFPLVADIFCVIVHGSGDVGESMDMKMKGVLLAAYAVCMIALDSQEAFFKPECYIVSVSLLAAHFIIMLFYSRLFQPTGKLKEMMAELMGLKQYIKVAEAQELRRIVTDNPQLFYRILAFGMAFGIAPKWVKKFRAINFMVGDN